MALNITKSDVLEYDNPWMFNNKPFNSDDIGNFVGFVYLIKSKLDDKLYIGRKYFYSKRKPKGSSRRKTVESDWKRYYSSSDVLKGLVKDHGKDCFERIILSLHTTEGDCNTEEVKQQFLNNVLEDARFINDNIGGKYFRKPTHIIESRVYNEYNPIQRNN